MSRRIAAVVLDLSGTTVDPYVLAPTLAIKSAFAKYHIDVSSKLVRKFMGIRKDHHINRILAHKDVRTAWEAVHSTTPRPGIEGKMLFSALMKELPEAVKKFCQPTPGTVEAFEELRRMDIKIGASTGFDRKIVNLLQPLMEKQDVVFDCIVAGGDVPRSNRPLPWMLYQNMFDLGVDDVRQVVKVDDTRSGILEGKFAGAAASVGVARYSNYMGVDSLFHASQLKNEALEARARESADMLRGAGADHVMADLSELPELIRALQDS